MSLAARLRAAQGHALPSASPEPRPAPTAPTASPVTAEPAPAPAVPRPVVEPTTSSPDEVSAAAGADDVLRRIKEKAADTLFARLGGRLNDTSLSEVQLHAMVQS